MHGLHLSIVIKISAASSAVHFLTVTGAMSRNMLTSTAMGVAVNAKAPKLAQEHFIVLGTAINEPSLGLEVGRRSLSNGLREAMVSTPINHSFSLCSRFICPGGLALLLGN